ncbi:hypothetical protein HII31_09083 [Pseudocercospora fuligena]|uniref:F-box domain-containing protein n=1 Tax=Pseudocercospora fuligena TaxID=685502 RepID=A0A8H6RDJ8_9PEZI|nr:hypothetical protein HII31_09083 [Pseudocercospora fuligena]
MLEMTALLQLPTELLHYIFSLVPPADIQALRLTCCLLKDVAQDLLLPTLTTFLHRPGIERLLRVASLSKEIRAGVKTLNFHIDALQECDDWDEWNYRRRIAFNHSRLHIESRLKLAAEDSWAGPPLTEEAQQALAEYQTRNLELDHYERLLPNGDWPPLAGHYAISQRHCEDQKLLIEESYVRTSMAALFRACPNLTALHFLTRAGSGVKHTARDAYFQQGLYAPVGLDDNYSSAAVEQTLMAAHDTTRTIREMRLEEVFYYYLTDAVDGLEPSEELLQAFNKLENLVWKLNDEPASHTLNFCPETEIYVTRDRIQSLAEGDFLVLMKAATNLKTLALTWDLPEDWPCHELARLGDMVGDIRWSKLRSIELSHFKSTFEELTAFFLRHKDTLESVAVRDAYLEEGELDHVFETLAGKLPRLKEVYLDGDFMALSGRYYTFDYDTGDELDKYLIEGGVLPQKPKSILFGGEPDRLSGQYLSNIALLSATQGV